MYRCTWEFLFRCHALRLNTTRLFPDLIQIFLKDCLTFDLVHNICVYIKYTFKNILYYSFKFSDDGVGWRRRGDEESGENFRKYFHQFYRSWSFRTALRLQRSRSSGGLPRSLFCRIPFFQDSFILKNIIFLFIYHEQLYRVFKISMWFIKLVSGEWCC